MIIRGIFIPRLPTVTASTKLNYGTFGIAMFGYIALQRRVWASAYTVSIADLCACAITVERSRYWREILRCGAKMSPTCSAGNTIPPTSKRPYSRNKMNINPLLSAESSASFVLRRTRKLMNVLLPVWTFGEIRTGLCDGAGQWRELVRAIMTVLMAQRSHCFMRWTWLRLAHCYNKGRGYTSGSRYRIPLIPCREVLRQPYR